MIGKKALAHGWCKIGLLSPSIPSTVLGSRFCQSQFLWNRSFFSTVASSSAAAVAGGDVAADGDSTSAGNHFVSVGDVFLRLFFGRLSRAVCVVQPGSASARTIDAFDESSLNRPLVNVQRLQLVYRYPDQFRAPLVTGLLCSQSDAAAALKAPPLLKFHQQAERTRVDAEHLYDRLFDQCAFTLDDALALVTEQLPSSSLSCPDLTRLATVLTLLQRRDLFACLQSQQGYWRCRDPDQVAMCKREQGLVGDYQRLLRVRKQFELRLRHRGLSHKLPPSSPSPVRTGQRNTKQGKRVLLPPSAAAVASAHAYEGTDWPESPHYFNNLVLNGQVDMNCSDVVLGVHAVRRHALVNPTHLELTDRFVFSQILRPLGYVGRGAPESLLHDLGYPLANKTVAALSLSTNLFTDSNNDDDPGATATTTSAGSATGVGAIPDLDQERRLDFDAGLRAYAIDSVDTTDVDDAFSLEPPRRPGERPWIHVHIADPTSFCDTATAFRRASTLYLPEVVKFMLPDRLRQTFSLDQGLGFGAGDAASSGMPPVRTMTVSVQLDQETGQIVAQELNVFRVPRLVRLSYTEVDNWLADGQTGGRGDDDCRLADRVDVDLSELHQLLQFARLRRQYRRNRGAVSIGSRDLRIKLAGPDRATVEQVSYASDSLSSLLVSEMMIMSAEAVARHATSAGSLAGSKSPALLDVEDGGQSVVPIAFRRQSPPQDKVQDLLPLLTEASDRGNASGPSSSLDSESVRMGLVAEFQLLGLMERATTGGDTGPGHWALGLDVYSRFSSPLRRYADLVTHSQLKDVMRGQEPRLSVAQTNHVLAQFDVLATLIKRAQVKTNLHWLTVHLAQDHDLSDASRIHDALVLSNNERTGSYQVLFPGFGFSWGWLPKKDVDLKGGDGSVGSLVLVSIGSVYNAIKTHV